ADLATDPRSAPAPAAAPILEIAGPRAENLVDAATRFARRRGDRVRIEGVSNPADPDSALYETGALLPGPNATLAGPTLQDWPDSGSEASRALPRDHRVQSNPNASTKTWARTVLRS